MQVILDKVWRKYSELKILQEEKDLNKLEWELFIAPALFFACLLELLACWPCFRIVGLISLTVGLFIGGVESIGRKVAICFSGNFL